MKASFYVFLIACGIAVALRWGCQAPKDKPQVIRSGEWILKSNSFRHVDYGAHGVELGKPLTTNTVAITPIVVTNIIP